MIQMKTINRKQAEELLLKSEVSKSQLDQDKNELCIIFKLEDGKTVLMKYNIVKQTKSYFLA